MLLGIIANVNKMMSIDLNFIYDKEDIPTKQVKVETGKIYNIVYRKRSIIPNGQDTICELYGKVYSIHEVEHPSPRHTIVRKYEQVGMNNSIYNGCTEQCITDSDKFINGKPLSNDILITVDTSDDYSGTYDKTLLSDMLECTLIDGSVKPITPMGPSDSAGRSSNQSSMTKSIKINGVDTEFMFDTNTWTASYIDKDGIINDISISILLKQFLQ